MPMKFAVAAHAAIIRNAQEFLRDHPEEERNSIGEVERRLTVEHTEAALWLEEKHNMVLDMYNLHNLIEFWPTARMMCAAAATAGGAAVVAMTETYTPDEFNPAHLIEYFTLPRDPAEGLS